MKISHQNKTSKIISYKQGLVLLKIIKTKKTKNNLSTKLKNKIFPEKIKFSKLSLKFTSNENCACKVESSYTLINLPTKIEKNIIGNKNRLAYYGKNNDKFINKIDNKHIKSRNIVHSSKINNRDVNKIPSNLKMIISILPKEQIEVGISENGILKEYYIDMLHQKKLKGNIYKGIINNIDTNLQAAFVDFGMGKNGFLQVDEVHPEYWLNYAEDISQTKKLPPIQKILKQGQEVLVQVVKEAAGNKGAFLTTWISLAGRFLVLTPGQEQVGVSRKVVNADERLRLKALIEGLDPGNGCGVIVRTVGEGATKTILKNDLQYLKRLWKDIRKNATEKKAPALIYQEASLSERSVRDYFTDDISEIWVDNHDELNKIKNLINMLFPKKKDIVNLFDNPKKTIWENFNLTKQLEQVYSREVNLPSGGRLVFDQTEALLAIDINSGKISGKGNFEAMAYKTNMEAALEIARQLRLRDVGGQVVIDFIEMKEKKHVHEVENCLRQAMKNDRARHDILKMSTFGLLELVRQRMGSSAISISMEPCAFCGGTGLRRNMEWQALQWLRDIKTKLFNTQGSRLLTTVKGELGMYLLNYKRDCLLKLEEEFNKLIEIQVEH